MLYGLLNRRKWHDKWYDTESPETVRASASQISQLGDGLMAALVLPKSGFPPAGPYNLYGRLANAARAHRTLIFRALKATPHKAFQCTLRSCKTDGLSQTSKVQRTTLNGESYLRAIISRRSTFSRARVTVPVPLDKNETHRLERIGLKSILMLTMPLTT